MLRYSRERVCSGGAFPLRRRTVRVEFLDVGLLFLAAAPRASSFWRTRTTITRSAATPPPRLPRRASWREQPICRGETKKTPPHGGVFLLFIPGDRHGELC